MLTRIHQALAQLETEHSIRILYACESGSRAWGFPSPDSDYDVRFIYCHPPAWYLGLEEGADTLNFPVDDLLDLGGWELRKALRLLRSSNAPLLEWLQSPILYQEAPGFREQLRPLLPRAFNLRAGLHHYLGMLRRGLESDLVAEPVRLKRLLYALRAALAARWIRQRQELPPMEFGQLAEVLPPPLQAAVSQLLAAKSRAAEKAPTLVEPALLAFLQQEYDAGMAGRNELPVPGGTDPAAELSAQFRAWLLVSFPT